MSDDSWIDVGASAELARNPCRRCASARSRIALTLSRRRVRRDLRRLQPRRRARSDEGTLDGDFVVCPWHYWKFHWRTGEGEPGYEEDRVPSHAVKVENGRVLVSEAAATKRGRLPHDPHPLARAPKREPGPIRILGLSTTAMTQAIRATARRRTCSTHALANAREGGERDCETRLIAVRDLAFRACEGFYSKSARACTWPCSITQMDSNDQMDQVYEGVVHWADVILVATPIRWGGASSLYYKMVERMNCIQNQETIANRHLLRNKVVGAHHHRRPGQRAGRRRPDADFFAELGCQFPQFPYIAHSRGWSAEDMENNEQHVRDSKFLHDGAVALVRRSADMARVMIESVARRGRAGPRRAQGPSTRHAEEPSMTTIAALWLPILLSAVIVFIASSIIHMAPLWHRNELPAPPDGGPAAGRDAPVPAAAAASTCCRARRT